MTNHFAYLIDDDSRDFFQKVAEEQAVSQLPKRKPRIALETVKTAAPVETQSTFEKVANHLDRDIEIIKMAGTCGIDMGATDRAMNYMSKLEADRSLSDNEYVAIFNKVAFEALEADFTEARANLHLTALPERRNGIDIELGKIASELIGSFCREWEDEFGVEKNAGLGRMAVRLGRKIIPMGGATGGVGAVRGVKGGVDAMVGASNIVSKAGRRVGKATAAASSGAGRSLYSAGITAKRVIRNPRAAAAGLRARWRQAVKVRAGKKLKKLQKREAVAVRAHSDAIKRGDAGRAGEEASNVRRLSQKKKKAKVKQRLAKQRLGESMTIRGTPPRSGKGPGGGKSSSKAKADQSRGKAKQEAAGAAAKGEAAVASVAEKATASGAEKATAPMSRARRQAEATFAGLSPKKGKGANTAVGAGVAADASQSRKAAKVKGDGGTPRRGKREGITRAEANHRARTKGSKRTPRMREKFRTPPAHNISTSSPAAAKSTMSTAKKEGWWGSLSDEQKKNIAIASGGGLLVGNAVD